MMVRCTRLYTNVEDASRFEDLELPLAPEVPRPDDLSASVPVSASAVLFGAAPPVAAIRSSRRRGGS
jgi:hypothetical protein